MVLNGIDNIDDYEAWFAHKRLGLITSVSGTDSRLVSTIDILRSKFTLAALFSPEHGIRGNVDAGGDVDAYVDTYTQIPVYSLYRKDSKRLTKEMLEAVDTLVYDIQDLGVRYYTFISTMYYAMQECERCQKEMIILDRINPLGDRVEGNLIQESFQSFVGAYPLCMRYGLTAGELAEMIYQEQQFRFPLKVLPVKGWKRKSLFSDTERVWVMPSLGIPRFETALLYPGTCLFEGTNLSEGRGTSAPFELIGAPYADGYKLARHMNHKNLPGAVFSPAYFTPFSSKYRGEACEGVHIHITDKDAFCSVTAGLSLLFAFRECYPRDFSFLPPCKEGERSMIELLFGNGSILEEGVQEEKLLSEFEADSRRFYERKSEFHLY